MKKRDPRILSTILATVVLIGVVPHAQADYITFSFEAEFSQFGPENLLTGTYSIDPTVKNDLELPNGQYTGAVTALSVSIDSVAGHMMTDPPDKGNIEIRTTSGGQYIVLSSDPRALGIPLVGEPSNGVQLTSFAFVLLQTGLSAGEMTPTSPPSVDPAVPNSSFVFLDYLAGDNPVSSVGKMLSLSTVSIPEPTTIMLFGLSLFALAFTLRRGTIHAY